MENDQSLLTVKENNDRLNYLCTEKEKESKSIKEDITNNAELVEDLVDQLNGLEEDNLLLTKYSGEDSSAVKVNSYTTFFLLLAIYFFNT